MYATQVQPKRRKKPELNLVFDKWDAGYMSYTEAIRSRKNALTDMTNCDLYGDGIPGVRWGTIKYGTQPLGTVIGMGTYTNATAPLVAPEKWAVSLQVVGGQAKVYRNKNGGSWLEVGGNYDTTAWTMFTQSNSRVYLSNGVNKMSYYNIATNTLVDYTPIAAPSAPTVTPTGLSGSAVTYRVRIAANNNVGETNASTATTVTVGEYRNSWDPNTQYITITWPQVVGASSYNIYIGTVAGEEQFLGNVVQPSAPGNVTFIDNNRAAINPFKKAPEGNSTEGPTLSNLTDSNGQLFGTGDVNNRYRYWYSGSGDKSGDFSPFNGGGWVDINLGGESLPVCVKAFRDGQGNSVVSILTRGSAGKGELYHQTFQQQTIGDYTITYPFIQRANGQAGTYGAMAVVEANNSLYYFTGSNFTTTGTKPQMMNIIVSNSISDTIRDDVARVNQSAAHKSVGLEYRNRIFWALPVGADKNNEIWIHDLSLGGAWILRWTIPCDYMWLYEDSTGRTHHCILSNNKILEFSETALTDDGVAFNSRLSIPTITFDKSGLQMASVEYVRMLLLRPQGFVQTNIYGLAEGNQTTQVLATKEVAPTTSPSGWDAILPDTHVWDFVLPPSSTKSRAQMPVPIEISEILSQLSVDLTTKGSTRYLLHSVSVQGKIIPGLYQGDE